MVNFTFEIEDFDIASLIKDIASIDGITINIFTGDAIGQAEEAVGAVEVQAPVQTGEPVTARIIPNLIDLSKNDYDKATQEAMNLRNAGYSWKAVGIALGISGKSAHRRIAKYEKKVAYQLEKSKEPKAPKKPVFEGLTDKDLYIAVYGLIRSSKDSGLPVFANHFASALALNHEKKYAKSARLTKFISGLHDNVCSAMHIIANALGISAVMAGPTKDGKGDKTVQLLVLNAKKLPSFEDLWELIEPVL